LDLESQANQDLSGAPIEAGVLPASPPPAAKPAPPAAATPKTPPALVESEPDPPVNKMRRRIVWATVAGFLTTCFLMFLRFFLPRAIFEPSSVFRIGPPSDYALGVDTKWQQQYRIWVTKTSDRLFVIYARCTHLGCTPDWKASENKFKCPCHGSGYDSEGINFEGPAPRPMDRAKVELDAEGQVRVDISKLFQWPKGEKGQFDDPGAFIQL
jgi:cytochrome b6-f complex iron-sulfur subunit